MSDLKQLIESLRYRPVATTAAQMREAAGLLERFSAALEKAADTFHDIERALLLLGHTIAAEAPRVAEAATREALLRREHT